MIDCDSLLTLTLKVCDPEAPSLSVTLTVTVYGLPAAVAYVWDWAAMAPAAPAEPEPCADPSPQSTSTAHGLSAPGSPNEPSVKDCDALTVADWSAGADTAGATFVTE